MTVYAITDTKKGRTGIAPTYLQTTRTKLLLELHVSHHRQPLILASKSTSASIAKHTFSLIFYDFKLINIYRLNTNFTIN